MRLTFRLPLSLEYEERFNRYAKNDRGEPLAVMPHPGRSLYADVRRAVAVPPRSRAREKSGTALVWPGAGAFQESTPARQFATATAAAAAAAGPAGKVLGIKSPIGTALQAGDR
jgi:hypothetical protein